MASSGDQLYLNPLHRTTPYIIGILMGYFLRMSSSRDVQLSQLALSLGWSLAGLAAYYSFFGPNRAYSRSYRYDVIDSTVYGSLQPFTWSLALSWVIFLCHTRQADVLNRVLSWKGFVVFTRIAYAFYIFQILVIFFGILSAPVPQYMTLLQIVDLNEIAVLLAISVLFTLLFLLPVNDLYNIVIANGLAHTPTACLSTQETEVPPSRNNELTH